ncbi:NAD-dependent epimerase [Salinimicrobium sediminilitoris]|uniref:NAD-dependent epimerase n=1 Tax=Salinimicrobium sediminilitoris TaxID=2876715 RepID=UPI001E483EC5|nr:NAD-dependent epimerase [Salinimicrobium sediminilitoris]MCC8358769.1 NAD-dependent epimerase [Salinimicrobium sediminilitoris]
MRQPNEIKILVTGAAGFIGFHLVKQLVNLHYKVVGLDNLNSYYDVNLKLDRLKELGIPEESAKWYNRRITSSTNDKFVFVKLNLEDREKLPLLCQEEKFDIVCNLAAQAGVRYSIENPEAYIDSNLTAFGNLLECCRHNRVKRLIYASSSSVYGQNEKIPFSTEDRVDKPVSLYAATKKSNELMAYTYSHLYNLETIGLRFFTVYGPWGRPDMAMFLFTDAISKGKPIKVFNNGDLERDFTFVDDIVEGMVRIIEKEIINKNENYSLYNIGNSKPVKLLDFINEIEKQLGKIAEKEMLPMQPGDVERTWADVTSLQEDFGYNPETSISEGVKAFVNWFKSYYN